ncbi:MAG TPA: hypothetical protein VJP04_08150, partial [Terriglobales bacterium]|nr:hypothetical protein [Terriglobales bacterium]
MRPIEALPQNYTRPKLPVEALLTIVPHAVAFCRTASDLPSPASFCGAGALSGKDFVPGVFLKAHPETLAVTARDNIPPGRMDH